jgi:hypothetical protein
VRVRALAGVDTTPLVQAVADTLSLSTSQQGALAAFVESPEQVRGTSEPTGWLLLLAVASGVGQ